MAGRRRSPWVGECGTVPPEGVSSKPGLSPSSRCPTLQEPLKSLRPKKADAPSSSSQKAREVKSAPLELQDEVADSECTQAGTRVPPGWKRAPGCREPCRGPQ